MLMEYFLRDDVGGKLNMCEMAIKIFFLHLFQSFYI